MAIGNIMGVSNINTENREMSEMGLKKAMLGEGAGECEKSPNKAISNRTQVMVQ